MKTCKSVLLFLCVLASAGCARQEKFTAVEQICIQNLSKQQAAQTAEKVLNDLAFKIDKCDAEQGIITTNPLPAAYFFELWRKDNVGSFNRNEANIQDLRRTARLTLQEQTGRLCINCSVRTERFNMEERPNITKNKTYESFSLSDQTRQKLKLDKKQKQTIIWTDLGRDNMLETEILNRIQKELAKNK